MANSSEAVPSTSTDVNSDTNQAKSLVQMAEEKFLNDIGATLELHTRSATFACGGSVPFLSDVKDDEPGSAKSSEQSAVQPIEAFQIRFGEGSNSATVQVPGLSTFDSRFQDLLSACGLRLTY